MPEPEVPSSSTRNCWKRPLGLSSSFTDGATAGTALAGRDPDPGRSRRVPHASTTAVPLGDRAETDSDATRASSVACRMLCKFGEEQGWPLERAYISSTRTVLQARWRLAAEQSGGYAVAGKCALASGSRQHPNRHLPAPTRKRRQSVRTDRPGAVMRSPTHHRDARERTRTQTMGRDSNADRARRVRERGSAGGRARAPSRGSSNRAHRGAHQVGGLTRAPSAAREVERGEQRVTRIARSSWPHEPSAPSKRRVPASQGRSRASLPRRPPRRRRRLDRAAECASRDRVEVGPLVIRRTGGAAETEKRRGPATFAPQEAV